MANKYINYSTAGTYTIPANEVQKVHINTAVASNVKLYDGKNISGLPIATYKASIVEQYFDLNIAVTSGYITTVLSGNSDVTVTYN